jgi:hypothetical protein
LPGRQASETLSDLQPQLLDLEPGVLSEEVEAESEREPLKAPPLQDNTSSSKPRRKHPDRQELPSHLKRVEQIIACTPEQCCCGKCGKQTTVIGYEETEVLDVRPAEYFVRVIKRDAGVQIALSTLDDGVLRVGELRRFGLTQALLPLIRLPLPHPRSRQNVATLLPLPTCSDTRSRHRNTLSSL